MLNKIFHDANTKQATSVKLNSVTFVPITNFCTSMYIRDGYDE